MVETRKKYKKVEKLRNFQNSPKTFPKTLFDHVLHDYFDGKKLCPVHPGDSKKFHRNRKEFKFSKMSKNVSKIVQTCFDVIFSRFFGQCTLEGRDVEKFQRNAKTSQNSRYPNTFPKVFKQVLDLFWGFFSKKKCPVHTEGSKLGTIRKKKSKTIWNFKSVQKRSLECPNMFWGDFIEIFCSVHPGGSRSRKISKNGKKIKFSKSRKTFPKVSKFVLRWLFSNFSRPVHPGDQKFEKRIEKIWIPKIIQNVLKSFQTSFELVLRYFSENVLPSAPWRVETWKNTRKMEKLSFFFQNAQKRSPKRSNTFWTCFEVVFSVKKFHQCTLDGRKLEKFEKKSKKIWNLKSVQKRSWKCPNKFWNCFEVIFSEKHAQCTLQSQNLEKHQKTGKTFKFSKCPKKVPKSNQTCFELVSR